MAKEYIIQKAVAPEKVVKDRRLSIKEYSEKFWAFRKYDGCCAILKDGKTFSRTGEEYKCLNELSEFCADTWPHLVIIGEAWWQGVDQFNLISGAFRRQVVNDRLELRVHDVIPRADFDAGYCGVPFRERGHEVSDEYCSGRISPATGWLAGAYGNAQDKCNELTDLGGYDGLVLRDPDGTWTVGSGTTGEIIKIKRKLSFDLKVLEVNTATGDKTGRTVYKLVCDFRGRSLGVGSGLPHTFDAVPKVGDIVEVEAMDYSSDGLLREPRFKGIRFDKLATDV